jgi:hypothetical protein
MSNKDLFKEAIADAKAVREAALANAKVALEEALAPKLQSMLSAKLQEMDMDDLEAEEEELQEKSLGQDTYRTDDFQHVGARERHAALEEDELEEDFDLSSILAELSDDEEKSEMNEAEEEAEEEEVEVEDEESEDEDESEEEAEDEAEDESEKITDLTVDELKDIIKDIIASEMGGDEMSADMGDMGGEEEMSIDLGGEEAGEEVAMEDEIDLEELLAELDAMGDQDDENESMYEAKKKLKKDDKEDKEEMKEAIATIETLRNELNEVNLLNAKLLYVNKVFKAKNLTESQKLKVIAQFDRATTTKEAKAIFESMNSAIAKSKKSTIKESLGFASKAAGVAPQKPIVDETMSRWQTLAGITKF